MGQMWPMEPSQLAYGTSHGSRNLVAGEQWPSIWLPSLLPNSQIPSLAMLPSPTGLGQAPSPCFWIGAGPSLFHPTGPSWGWAMPPPTSWGHAMPLSPTGVRLGLGHAPFAHGARSCSFPLQSCSLPPSKDLDGVQHAQAPDENDQLDLTHRPTRQCPSGPWGKKVERIYLEDKWHDSHLQIGVIFVSVWCQCIWNRIHPCHCMIYMTPLSIEAN